MSTRSLARLSKCKLNARASIFYRFFTTGKTTSCYKAASQPKYEAIFGAHCRAPHDKKKCEDAYFIWNVNGIAAFGRLVNVRYFFVVYRFYENFRA